MTGWGPGAWGSSPWGTGGEELRLIAAQPVRENVARLEFNVAPRLTFLSDPRDGAAPNHYNFVPVAGTKGRDGLPTHPVSPFEVRRALVPNAFGRYLDVAVDLRFSPYEARYIVSVNGLVAFDGIPLQPGFTSVEMDGLTRGLPVQISTRAIGRGDMAGTVDYDDGNGPGVPVDDVGDSGRDEGLASYRKRVLRRVQTRRGAFAHLPGYGVGVPDEIKRLATQSVRARLAAEAESQIKREPETLDVKAQFVSIVGEPGSWTLSLLITAKAGSLSMSVSVRE